MQYSTMEKQKQVFRKVAIFLVVKYCIYISIQILSHNKIFSSGQSNPDMI